MLRMQPVTTISRISRSVHSLVLAYCSCQPGGGPPFIWDVFSACHALDESLHAVQLVVGISCVSALSLMLLAWLVLAFQEDGSRCVFYCLCLCRWNVLRALRIGGSMSCRLRQVLSLASSIPDQIECCVVLTIYCRGHG